VKDTIEIMQHELDAILDEGFALFTEAMHGNHGDHPLTVTTQAHQKLTMLSCKADDNRA
jgi:hypothetical protein